MTNFLIEAKSKEFFFLNLYDFGKNCNEINYGFIILWCYLSVRKFSVAHKSSISQGLYIYIRLILRKIKF